MISLFFFLQRDCSSCLSLLVSHSGKIQNYAHELSSLVRFLNRRLLTDLGGSFQHAKQGVKRGAGRWGEREACKHFVIDGQYQTNNREINWSCSIKTLCLQYPCERWRLVVINANSLGSESNIAQILLKIIAFSAIRLL